MSLVAEPPAIHVIGRVGCSPRTSTACGTVGMIVSRSRTTTCLSGTSEMARRPWSGSPSRTIVPEIEMPTREQVSTASISLRSRVAMAFSRESSTTVRPLRAAASL